jgi:hypothetical protein
MADKNQASVVQMLHSYGFIVRADPTMRYATADEPGRADLMCVHNGLGVMIECKNSEMAFNLSEWTPRQRDWAQNYCVNEPFNVDYFVALTLGVDRPNANPVEYAPKRTWLIPCLRFVYVCSIIEPIQASLPYRATKGYSLILQEKRWDAINLFGDFELPWGKNPDGKGGWTIPNNHVFYQDYIAIPELEW